VTDLSYLDVRPVLAKLAALERELVLVGGQAVNFWAAHYENRVPELAIEAPFALDSASCTLFRYSPPEES
jgi:hypothetical protein